MTATTFAVSPSQSQRWRAVIAASVGNALEWFDFVVYGFFAVTMAKLSSRLTATASGGPIMAAGT